MSEQSTRLTEQHFEYIASHTRREDEFLRSLKAAATAAGIPPISVAPEQASFMRILLQAIRAQEVVEVGTLAGYSAISMARALPPGGRVRTIELNARHATFAAEWVMKSDVADKVEVIQGAGMDVLRGFASESADAAFLDADKASYPAYLNECLRIVRPKGVIMVDNAFAFGQLFDEHPTDKEVEAVRAFNEHMASVRTLDSVMVPIGDGLWVSVKRAE